jgi:hypothetical protein
MHTNSFHPTPIASRFSFSHAVNPKKLASDARSTISDLFPKGPHLILSVFLLSLTLFLYRAHSTKLSNKSNSASHTISCKRIAFFPKNHTFICFFAIFSLSSSLFSRSREHTNKIIKLIKQYMYIPFRVKNGLFPKETTTPHHHTSSLSVFLQSFHSFLLFSPATRTHK